MLGLRLGCAVLVASLPDAVASSAIGDAFEQPVFGKRQKMLHSQIVEVNGTFVGAAITIQSGFRFRAVHFKVEELDESVWRSLDELRTAVWRLFTNHHACARGSRRRSNIADTLQRAAAE